MQDIHIWDITLKNWSITCIKTVLGHVQSCRIGFISFVRDHTINWSICIQQRIIMAHISLYINCDINAGTF